MKGGADSRVLVRVESTRIKSHLVRVSCHNYSLCTHAVGILEIDFAGPAVVADGVGDERAVAGPHSFRSLASCEHRRVVLPTTSAGSQVRVHDRSQYIMHVLDRELIPCRIPVESERLHSRYTTPFHSRLGRI